MARAAPKQISRVAFWWTQNTGAPISRSRTVPPPTPVTTAKKRKVTSVCFFTAASRAPGQREHRDPRHVEEIEDRPERGGELGDGHVSF